MQTQYQEVGLAQLTFCELAPFPPGRRRQLIRPFSLITNIDVCTCEINLVGTIPGHLLRANQCVTAIERLELVGILSSLTTVGRIVIKI